jgi:uracil-DNA glycosylase family 4
VNIESKIVACVSCKLRDYCNKPLPPEQNYDIIDIMVVSDRPSKEEDDCEWSWGDRSSRYVADLINKEFDEGKTYYTYLTKCHSTVSLPKKFILPCVNSFLTQEIDLYKPKIILYLGSASKKYYKVNMGDIRCSSFPFQYSEGFWQSPHYIYNGGKTKTKEFLEFLNKLKGASSV